MEAKQSSSQVRSKNATRILTSDREGQKQGIKCESVQSGENDTDTQGGPALSTRLFLCLFTSPPLSLLGRLTLPFIRLTAHRRDEWQCGEG